MCAEPKTLRLPAIVRRNGIRVECLLKELANYDWFQKKEWQSEIQYMLDSGLKYELDALAKKNFRFLTTDYLPKKLKDRDWLD